MTDRRDIEGGRARGPRLWSMIAPVVLAFVIGVALAVYVVRRDRPERAPAAVAAPAAPRPAAVRPQPAVAAQDPATLATREGVLAAQLAALEARATAIDLESSGAEQKAVRAEAILTAAAVRRAIDRGQPLGDLEAPLRARFGQGQPGAVAILLHAGRQPITLESLRADLDAAERDLLVAPGTRWLSHWRAELGRLVVIRDGKSRPDSAADRLQRARLLLDSGQIEAARAEVATLPGAARATGWNAAAARYALIRAALDRIEAVALTSTNASPSVLAAPGAAPTGNP